MNSYNDQQPYQGYATQISDSIDPQQYERQQFYAAPPMANPPVEPINQPYQQQQQGYMPPPGQQSSYAGFNPSELGGTGAAGLCYIGLWLTGLLFLIFGNQKRLVRFHAMQSLLFFGGYTIMMIFLINLIEMHLFLIHGFAIFALVMINIVAFVGWFVGIINAFQGKYTKLPIVGEIAERYVNGDIHLK